MTERLLSSKEVQEITGIRSRLTLWKKSRNDQDIFPMPYNDGCKFTRWKMSEVQAWIVQLELA